MKPEGEGWITTQQAAQMLQLPIKSVYYLAEKRRLQLHGGRPQNYCRIEEVEALARSAAHARRIANRAFTLNRRKTASAEDARIALMNCAEAARRLGITPPQVRRLVDRGKLTVYLANSRVRFWFAVEEIEQLYGEREQRRQKRARQKPSLPRSRTIEVGDLSVWERYFGDWLTTRQVAWMLHVSPQTVSEMRQKGRLHGVRQEILMGGRVQWHYRKAEVQALMNDPAYVKRRQTYARFCTPEGKAERKREMYARQMAEIEDLIKRGVMQQKIEDWLREAW